MAKISRETGQQPKVKMDFKMTSFFTEFNPLLPDLIKLIRNILRLLYSDPKIKSAFPEKLIKLIHKGGKNLNKILSLSSFLSTKNQIAGSVSNCNNRCDICTNFMVFYNVFKCMAIGKYYKVKGTLSCNCVKVVYLITMPYIGSTISFRERFCIHKSDVNTGKKDVLHLNISQSVALVKVNLITLRSGSQNL